MQDKGVFMKTVCFLSLVLVLLFSCSRHRNDIQEEDELPKASSSSCEEDSLLYKTTEIGTQTWLAENLNEVPVVGNSWCISDAIPNMGYACDKKRGRLYDWDAANSVCPCGWKLPSERDYNILLKYAEGYAENVFAGEVLKSANGWGDYGGLDLYGFAALPGGYRSSNGHFLKISEEAYWWSSSAEGDYAQYRFVKDDKRLHSGSDRKTSGYSVRCIKH